MAEGVVLPHFKNLEISFFIHYKHIMLIKKCSTSIFNHFGELEIIIKKH